MHRARSRIIETKIQRKMIKRFFYKSRNRILTDNSSRYRGSWQGTDNRTRRSKRTNSKYTRRMATIRLTKGTKRIIK